MRHAGAVAIDTQTVRPVRRLEIDRDIRCNTPRRTPVAP
jgi:hypothetical protein